jgi:hypothetical protein
MSWFVLDNAEMDFEKASPFKPYSTKQKTAMLRHAEGHLRSRSGGLLEVSQVLVADCGIYAPHRV